MKIFVSWSGESSKRLAQALYDWIPNVIQSVEPYMSSEDIRQGSRWFADISDHLEESQFGILCLTPDNLDAQWLLFEAGALSKFVDISLVVPYLFNLSPSDLQGPLAQFQATRADEQSTRKMMHDLNSTLGEQKLTESRLDLYFSRWWPELEAEIKAIGVESAEETSPRQEREVREILEEILEVVRQVSRQSFEDLPEIKSSLQFVRNSMAHSPAFEPERSRRRALRLEADDSERRTNAQRMLEFIRQLRDEEQGTDESTSSSDTSAE